MVANVNISQNLNLMCSKLCKQWNLGNRLFYKVINVRWRIWFPYLVFQETFRFPTRNRQYEFWYLNMKLFSTDWFSTSRVPPKQGEADFFFPTDCRSSYPNSHLTVKTVYGAVWLSFWCSTRPSADDGHGLVPITSW